MISFRYHLVTIVAVFLALGLGVLMGTTVVKQSVINNLQSQADSAIETTHRLQGDIGDLRGQLRQWSDFGQAAQALLIDGQLTGRSVVILAADGVNLSDVDAVRTAMRDAGATLTGVLAVTPRMRLSGTSDAAALAALLGLDPALPPDDLMRQAGARLGIRLATGVPTAPGGGGQDDLLRRLVSGGYVTDQFLGPEGLGGVGGGGQAVLILSGGPAEPTGDPASDPQDLFVPLVTSLTQGGAPAAAGEPQAAAGDVVALIRGDASLDGQVLTVDDIDTMPGRVAIVLGMRDLLAGTLGRCGDFGVKAGACSLLPPPIVPSPTP